MNVLATEYSLSTNSLDIYLAGCNPPHCAGCHNPETWDFKQGQPWQVALPAILTKIHQFPSLVTSLFILGGEPLHQPIEGLLGLLNPLALTGLPLWLFTRLPLSKVDKRVLELCAFVKCGRYVQHLSTNTNIQHGLKLASSNQAVFKKGVDY